LSLPAGWAEAAAMVGPQAAEPVSGSPHVRDRLAALEALAQQELARTPLLPMPDLPAHDDPAAILVAWDLAFCRPR